MRWFPKDPCRWRKWFAWYPVTVEVNSVLGSMKYKQKVWLEVIERQIIDAGLNTNYRLL